MFRFRIKIVQKIPMIYTQAIRQPADCETLVLWTSSPHRNTFPSIFELQKPFRACVRIISSSPNEVKGCDKLLNRFCLQWKGSWCTCATFKGPPFFEKQELLTALHMLPLNDTPYTYYINVKWFKKLKATVIHYSNPALATVVFLCRQSANVPITVCTWISCTVLCGKWRNTTE